jgi:hypothetical protein
LFHDGLVVRKKQAPESQIKLGRLVKKYTIPICLRDFVFFCLVQQFFDIIVFYVPTTELAFEVPTTVVGAFTSTTGRNISFIHPLVVVVIATAVVIVDVPT